MRRPGGPPPMMETQRMNGLTKTERMNLAEIAVAIPPESFPSDEMMVLLVNPAPELLDEMSALLRRRGIAVLKALDAGEALRLLRMEARIGVVVADVHILQDEGMELAVQLLQGDVALPPAELVLLTEPRLSGAGAGVEIGLAPLRLRDVAANVGRALGRAAARRTAGRLQGD